MLKIKTFHKSHCTYGPTKTMFRLIWDRYLIQLHMKRARCAAWASAPTSGASLQAVLQDVQGWGGKSAH